MVLQEDLVSIVVPVYNAEKYLKECVDSITNQTYKKIEVLLVDDGSKDGSGALCDELAAKDSRIRVFHNENGGPAAARSCGIQNARGEYLMFVDSDDWIEPKMIADMRWTIKKHQTDLVLCGYGRFPDGAKADTSTHTVSDFSLVILNSKQELATLFNKPKTSLAGVSLWAKLYKTAIIKDNGVDFPPKVNYEEDCRFNLQYYRHVKTAAVMRNKYYHYRQVAASLSKNYSMQGFRFLRDGYNARRDFFREIGLGNSMGGLDMIFLLVTVTNLQKVERSPMSREEKKRSYQEILQMPEVQYVAQSCALSKKRLTRNVMKAVRSQSLGALNFCMVSWKLKEKLDDKLKPFTAFLGKVKRKLLGK